MERLPRPPEHRQPALIARLMRDPRPVLDKLRADHGPMVALGRGPMRMAIVGDPMALRDLFRSPTDDYRWNHRFNVLGFVVGRTSIIVSDGTDWERRRAPLRAGFSRRRIDGWIDATVRCADDHLDRLVGRLGGASAVVELDVVCRQLVQEVVVSALFGRRLTARSAEIAGRFASAQAYLESPFYRQVPHPLPIGRRGRVRSDLKAIRSLVDEQIARLRAEPSGDPLDVLEALLLDGTLSDEETRDQVVTLMGAGLDTTSASLCWMLSCATLAGPDLWRRLRAEADEVLAGDAPFDDTHLARLELARRTMKETTRLHPAGSFSPRMAHVDVGIGGYEIPKGTLILWSAHLAGRDPDVWADPLRFDPDRLLDPSDAQRELAELAWVPFGRGHRSCIGFALAQMELTVLIARFAQRLDVEPLSTAAPRAVGMVVNRPHGGVRMRVSARAS